MAAIRSDHQGPERQLYAKNKKRILETQSLCALCGHPVNKRLKYPHPLSATVDHIIPVSKGGTSDIDNLQLAHFWCNRQKSDKLITATRHELAKERESYSPTNLPQSTDWAAYVPPK